MKIRNREYKAEKMLSKDNLEDNILSNGKDSDNEQAKNAQNNVPKNENIFSSDSRSSSPVDSRNSLINSRISSPLNLRTSSPVNVARILPSQNTLNDRKNKNSLNSYVSNASKEDVPPTETVSKDKDDGDSKESGGKQQEHCLTMSNRRPVWQANGELEKEINVVGDESEINLTDDDGNSSDDENKLVINDEFDKSENSQQASNVSTSPSVDQRKSVHQFDNTDQRKSVHQFDNTDQRKSVHQFDNTEQQKILSTKRVIEEDYLSVGKNFKKPKIDREIIDKSGEETSDNFKGKSDNRKESTNCIRLIADLVENTDIFVNNTADLAAEKSEKIADNSKIPDKSVENSALDYADSSKGTTNKSENNTVEIGESLKEKIRADNVNNLDEALNFAKKDLQALEILLFQKEQEWNQLLRLTKRKEEIYLRLLRKKHVCILKNPRRSSYMENMHLLDSKIENQPHNLDDSNAETQPDSHLDKSKTENQTDIHLNDSKTENLSDIKAESRALDAAVLENSEFDRKNESKADENLTISDILEDSKNVADLLSENFFANRPNYRKKILIENPRTKQESISKASNVYQRLENGSKSPAIQHKTPATGFKSSEIFPNYQEISSKYPKLLPKHPEPEIRPENLEIRSDISKMSPENKKSDIEKELESVLFLPEGIFSSLGTNHFPIAMMNHVLSDSYRQHGLSDSYRQHGLSDSIRNQALSDDFQNNVPLLINPTTTQNTSQDLKTSDVNLTSGKTSDLNSQKNTVSVIDIRTPSWSENPGSPLYEFSRPHVIISPDSQTRIGKQLKSLMNHKPILPKPPPIIPRISPSSSGGFRTTPPECEVNGFGPQGPTVSIDQLIAAHRKDNPVIPPIRCSKRGSWRSKYDSDRRGLSPVDPLSMGDKFPVGDSINPTLRTHSGRSCNSTRQDIEVAPSAQGPGGKQMIPISALMPKGSPGVPVPIRPHPISASISQNAPLNDSGVSYNDVLLQFAQMTRSDKQIESGSPQISIIPVSSPGLSKLKRTEPIPDSTSITREIPPIREGSVTSAPQQQEGSSALAKLLLESGAQNSSASNQDPHCLTLTALLSSSSANKEKITASKMPPTTYAQVLNVENMRSTSKLDGKCQGCFKNRAQFVCAGCGNQWYCSKQCQVTAWEKHSSKCVT